MNPMRGFDPLAVYQRTPALNTQRGDRNPASRYRAKGTPALGWIQRGSKPRHPLAVGGVSIPSLCINAFGSNADLAPIDKPN